MRLEENWASGAIASGGYADGHARSNNALQKQRGQSLGVSGQWSPHLTDVPVHGLIDGYIA